MPTTALLNMSFAFYPNPRYEVARRPRDCEPIITHSHFVHAKNSTLFINAQLRTPDVILLIPRIWDTVHEFAQISCFQKCT